MKIHTILPIGASLLLITLGCLTIKCRGVADQGLLNSFGGAASCNCAAASGAGCTDQAGDEGKTCSGMNGTCAAKCDSTGTTNNGCVGATEASCTAQSRNCPGTRYTCQMDKNGKWTCVGAGAVSGSFCGTHSVCVN